MPFDGALQSVLLRKPVTVPQGLVGYWPLNLGSLNWGSNTAFDKSGFGNNGTLTNQTSAALGAGKVRECLTFNGSNQYVIIPSSPLFNFTNGGLLAWFKTSTTGAYQAILDRDGELPADRQYQLRVSTANKIEFIAIWGSVVAVTSPGTVTDGNWHHVAATMFFDGTNTILLLYIDGRLVASGSVDGAMPAITYNMMIGGHKATAPYILLTGSVGQARVYNRTPPAQEILSIYQAGLSGRA